MRLRLPGGSVGCRVRRTGFFRFGFVSGSTTGEQRSAGAEAAIEVDHAESACQADVGIADLAGACRTGELADRFHGAEESACGARLSDRELPAGSVERKGAVMRERVRADELGRLLQADPSQLSQAGRRTGRNRDG